ncbi:MAG: D-glycero-beta-D-manno-heptose 1-phosphate adenylyltransferase [Proteobacteria bacterium]|nr:D-glycero-beta-D-manno-heptose 1-phosphate adenylyltransferase [Pseudomonadota bacterium]MBU1650286.1 D-glycero-beta-D-manno-heptose 1-phosphate adenylyltransferase [Pseudomonadota bacterium]MBU1985619.1 D-glycero-beta-D-manno-heptose 1-phosphate adenylyltransferase [Pseudomonadota bacterium]
MVFEFPSFVSAGFFQFAITPGEPSVNLDRMRAALHKDPPVPGTLLLLPELWATGFVYPQLAELSRETPRLLEQLTELAARYRIVLAGSLVERVDDERRVLLYNTLFFSGSDGQTGKIRKQHLFSYWREDEWLTAGESPRPVATASGWVGGLVCYDLRFPETAKVQCQQGASLLVVSAQWPLMRIDQWRILLQARAIENQTFIVSANGCGMCNDIELGGHSLIIDPGGEILLEAGEEEQLATITLDWQKLQQLRERFNTVAPTPYPFDDREKILSLAECVRIVGLRKMQGQRIVFTNGCFDILHAGHVEYLQQARKQGDFLVLGLNSDRSIQAIKGCNRPINEEFRRARVLAALGCVDAIVIFSDETPLGLITALLPHVMVKGADWQEDAIVGAQEVKANGGKVVRIPFTTETSTTKIIEKIRE